MENPTNEKDPYKLKIIKHWKGQSLKYEIFCENGNNICVFMKNGVKLFSGSKDYVCRKVIYCKCTMHVIEIGV